MKVKDIIRQVEKDGWFIVRIKGSHRQFRHPVKRGLVTIPGHLNDDVAKGTLSSIFKQADLKK